MDGFVFLGLNEAWWFGGLPFFVFLFWAEYSSYERNKKHIDDLTSRLPNEKIYIDISDEEKFMLDNLSKRESMNNEKYIRDILKMKCIK